MRFFLFFILMSSLTYAQDKVSVDLTIKNVKNIPLEEKSVWIGPLGMDMGYRLKDDSFNELYNGFQYLSWLDYSIPIHIEENDKFTIDLQKNLNPTTFYYTGGKGAIKNNYVFERYLLTLDIESDTTLYKKPKDEFINFLKVKKDSMLNVSKGFALSDKFIEDERKFWNYYIQFNELFYDTLRSQETPTFPDDITLDAFYDIDYNNSNDYFNYRDYLNISVLYFYLKMNEANDYDELKYIYKDIESSIVKYKLREVLRYQVLNNHPKSEDYIKILKRFDYQDEAYYGY